MVVLKNTGSVQVYFLGFNKKVLLEIVLLFVTIKANEKLEELDKVIFAGLRLREWIKLYLAKKKKKKVSSC